MSFQERKRAKMAHSYTINKEAKRTIDGADITFSAILLDPTEGTPPLKEYDYSNPKYPVLAGCYAFYDPTTYEVAYVGKAIQLPARLKEHWNVSDTLLNWENDDFCPYVAVWYCDPSDRAALEERLIRQLKPTLNRNIAHP
jgi:hypothetical protein